MIRVNANETFPITASISDEDTGNLISGQVVQYELRDMEDNELSPGVSGVLTESSVVSGIYRSTASVSTPGLYLIYTTCSGYLPAGEELFINPENIYELVKSARPYNIMVEDVLRENASSTASQMVRNVSLNITDYITTHMKWDDDTTWSGTTVSGVSYAWYRTAADTIPYRMGPAY